MSLQIDLQTPLKIVKQPLVEETINEIVIERIVDVPKEKKVFVFIKGQRIELPELSGDNYDNPDEWTNADIVAAVKAHYKVK
jgi:hypothetical protein